MGSRPQLYGIADSPVGLAAWLLDHNDADGQPAAAVASALKRTASATGELTRDEILDNISLYWLTNTGVSTSRLYWEYKGGFFNAKGVSIPVAVSVFPGEQYEAPRSWTERAYPKLLYYNKVDKGGHFAAWEQPQLFSNEVRAGSDRCADSSSSGAAEASRVGIMATASVDEANQNPCFFCGAVAFATVSSSGFPGLTLLLRSAPAAAFFGTSNATLPLSTGWWFASTSSISTLCGPGGNPRRMSGVPLASAQCHGAPSTVT